MAYPFDIVEHVIPGQHIREYVHSINGPQEIILQLAIKQYIPKDRLDPVPNNAVTVIAAHGVGFPKVRTSISMHHRIRIRDFTSLRMLTTLCRNCMSHSGKIFMLN